MNSALAPLLASIAPVAGAPLMGFLRDASGRPVMRFPTAVLDMKGTLDDTIPANISNSVPTHPEGGPHGSAWSSDDFWYTPTDNLTQAWSEVNQCEGAEHAYHYRTQHDGLDDFYCVAPFGQCLKGWPLSLSLSLSLCVCVCL